MDDFEIPSLLFRVQGYADLLSVENPKTTTETIIYYVSPNGGEMFVDVLSNEDQLLSEMGVDPWDRGIPTGIYLTKQEVEERIV